MLKIGLTGNIGSGKTIVGRIFETLGIRVYYADQKAKLFLSSPEIIVQIGQTFGNAIFEKNNIISRKKLANLVFLNSEKLHLLNKIVHPAVIADFESWLQEKNDFAFSIMESALLFDTGYSTLFNKLIIVSAPEELRISRVMKRDGVSAKDVKMRMKNQIPEKDQINAKASPFLIL